jgi:hypothetical protein
MASSTGGSEVLGVIATALGASREANNAISLPTVVLPRRWFGEAKGVDLVDAVACWFDQHGFSAERSYKNGAHGYTELFRQLGSWYPWDIQAIHQAQTDKIVQRRKVAEMFPQLAWPESVEAASEELFEARLRLLHGMTEEQFPSLYEAIFDSWEDEEEGRVVNDGGPPRVGAPDLFVWHSRPDLPSWFFCEVKAYGDYFGRDQYVWLREWWGVIGGRYLLLMVDPSS